MSSSRTLSKVAESLLPGGMTGMILRRSRSPKSSEASSLSRARIQFTLPMSVLISPLWAITRYGWASGQLGNVFVLKRECTSASALRISGCRRSGKKLRSWSGMSIPFHTIVRDENEAA